jgi:hypothetical protein
MEAIRNNMKLIKEEWNDVQLIEEAASDGKPKSYFIEGIFMQSNIKNRNGRLYPQDLLSKAVQTYNENYVLQKRAFGELGHPDSPSINLDRVSHIITSIKEDGSNYVGKAKILDTPFGRIVKSLLGEGVKLGVSSRGMGTLRTQSDGTNVVQDNFMLATAADIVHDPSAPSAFVNGIMEGAEWTLVNGVWVQQAAEQIREELSELTVKQINERRYAVFEQFMKKLGKQ